MAHQANSKPLLVKSSCPAQSPIPANCLKIKIIKLIVFSIITLPQSLSLSAWFPPVLVNSNKIMATCLQKERASSQECSSEILSACPVLRANAKNKS